MNRILLAKLSVYGFLLIDKPEGPTSHDIVDRVRRATQEKRVGHAGTLDPFASGLLLVGVGREATREFPKLVGLDKTYEATFALGASSDTDDKTGHLTPDPAFRPPSDEAIREALQTFVGEIEQIPPAYSAIKIGGKKMYEAAREGKPLEAKARQVTIRRFELLDRAQDFFLEVPTGLGTASEAAKLHGSGGARPVGTSFRVQIDCGSGTYIRALARDLGAKLGTGGYVEALRRTAIGPFTVAEAVLSDSPDMKTRILPVSDTLARLA